jgi:hypothetical protein
MDFKWYDDIPANSTIEQGDIIENCNVIIPNEKHYQAILENKENEEALNVIEIKNYL